MTQDLKLVQDSAGLYDLEIDSGTGQYRTVQGMETAITVSLFSDARAPAAQVTNAGLRRGWIGDVLTADINQFLGSTLWTYSQSRITQATLNGIRTAAEQAFTNMINQGIITGVTATVELSQDNRGISVGIELRRTDNTVERYDRLWRRTDVT